MPTARMWLQLQRVVLEFVVVVVEVASGGGISVVDDWWVTVVDVTSGFEAHAPNVRAAAASSDSRIRVMCFINV